jgi:MFS family permease
VPAPCNRLVACTSVVWQLPAAQAVHHREMTAGRKLSLTRRELAFVLTVCFSLTFQATNFAMMAAFFPLYAADVGISITQTNVVFIAYSVAKMLMSPVAGALASRFGRRPVMIGGIALVGCSTIFIGMTPDLTRHEVQPLVVVMTGARILQGIGLSCSQLATFAMLSDSFPAHRGLVSGSAISAIGLGWAIGPPIGGVLYVIGGFRLPFVVMGAIPLCLLCPLVTLTASAGAMQSSGPSIAAHSSKGTDTVGRQVWRDKTPIQLVVRKADVWIVAFTAFGYMSKWGWWDIQVRQRFSTLSESYVDFNVSALRCIPYNGTLQTECCLPLFNSVYHVVRPRVSMGDRDV